MIEVTEIINSQEWKSDLNKFEFNLFITSEWIESFADNMKKPVYLNFNKGDVVVGKIAGLIIDYKNSNDKKLFFFSGPAFQASNKETIPLLVNELLNYAILKKFRRLIVKSYDYKMTYGKDKNTLKITNRYEYVINLLQSSEEIQNNFNRLLLRKVKLAIRSKAEFIKGDSMKMLDNLISLLEETKKTRLTKGYSKYSYFYMPYLDKIVLKKIISNKITNLYYVKVNDEINCMTMVLTYAKDAYAFLIGSNSNAYGMGIPYYIMYCIIKELKEKQFNYYNLGGIPTDESGKGLILFKKSLGAQEVLTTHCSTNYLTLPHKLLNPLLNIGRKLPDNTITKIIKNRF
jgi:lipid II:glycine glycyltransferase (peptidoglycan interpeptide bridge formation enzyme)